MGSGARKESGFGEGVGGGDILVGVGNKNL